LHAYILVRNDIPLADQIVQAAHACLEAGFKFPKPGATVNLVLLCVESESQLLAALEEIRLRGIQFVQFYEPDDDMGFTAACTEPLKDVYRREFRRLPLWTPPREAVKT
jgi:hypothetical protein